MNKEEYLLYKNYLLDVLKNRTNKFIGMDLNDINIALYCILYNLYNNANKDIDKIDTVCEIYFGTNMKQLDINFKSKHNKSKNAVFKQFMFLVYLGHEKRRMFLYFTESQCHTDEEIDKDCIKLIPVNKYKELKQSGLDKQSILTNLGIKEKDIYLFLDMDKFKQEYMFDTEFFGTIFKIECAEDHKFHKLCEMLYKGSDRPTSEGMFSSYRCKCWPDKNVDDII
jgi:hypothetical protein